MSVFTPASAPPPGSVVADGLAFHTLYDAEWLSEVPDADEQVSVRVFVDPRRFQRVGRRPKRWPHECNLEGLGACLPQGQVKWVDWVSVNVEGASDADEVEVSFIFAAQVVGPWRAVNGTKHAFKPSFVVKRDDEGWHRVVFEGPEAEASQLRLLPQEQFCVEVRAPAAFAGRYVRVSLHGPIAIGRD